MKQENYIKGMTMIILSAFFFACMNVSVRLAGDLPTMQKSFFRNLVAAAFAAAILMKNPRISQGQQPLLGAPCHAVHLRDRRHTLQLLRHRPSSGSGRLDPEQTVPLLRDYFSFLILKEKITPIQASCVMLAFIGCLFVVKPGFQNAALIPALIGVCGGLGAGIAYTMVRVLGTHGIKGPVIVFYFSMFPACFFCHG